jgi:hypothetical protein
MLGVFAEFETNLRRERQLEGIIGACIIVLRRRNIAQFHRPWRASIFNDLLVAPFLFGSFLARALAAITHVKATAGA